MLTYLNYAGLAPLRLESYLSGLFAPELFGNVLLPKMSKQIERLREKVSLWLGCRPDQVAFVPSTSMGLMLAAHSLHWKEGDAALYPSQDFPANRQPWESLSRYGVKAQGVDSWEKLWAQNTRMISLSTVDFTTGIEQPWQEIISKARSANIWTCVDAIQSAGIKPSWQPDIDFWCTGTQKWLASGLGLAILVLSDRVLKELTPPFPNWLSLKEPGNLMAGLDPTAHGWEMGWVTPSALSRLENSLDYFQKIGWDQVSHEVKWRRDYLHEQLLETGWRVASCAKQWSGIVSIRPEKEGDAERIVKNGYQRKIITAHRGACIRLSPHIFTSKGQLRKVSQWLQKCYIEQS